MLGGHWQDLSEYWHFCRSKNGGDHVTLGPMTTTTSSPVTAVRTAAPVAAVAHFGSLLAFETDCWDVQASLAGAAPGAPDFVLLDVRSPESFGEGHVPGAVNLPHRKIVEATLTEYPEGTLFVVYCSGPHCNGADKAALRLARLGRPVKKMIGGIEGWKNERFSLESV
jgi:rhodanese-related sulfurtransferase